MSQQRVVRNEIWDDEWFYDLERDEKLVWLFLLTNVRCNIAGVYKLNVKWAAATMSFSSESELEAILERFVEDKKIFRLREWIVLINFVKHQAKNPSVIKGIERVVKEVPSDVWDSLRQSVTDCPTLLYLTLPNLTLRVGDEKSSPTPPPKEKKPKKEKRRYGEMKNVLLTDEEKQKLIDKYGRSAAKDYVDKLSLHISSKSKRYKSHYATILAWMRRDGVVVEKKPVQPSMEPEKPLSKEDQERLARKRAEITKSLTMNKK